MPLRHERIEAVWMNLKAIARGAENLAHELQELDGREGLKPALQQAQTDAARLVLATLDLARQIGRLQELAGTPE